MNLKPEILSSIIEKLKTGPVKPETEEEKQVFQLLNDLDHVNYKVHLEGVGHLWQKRLMRLEYEIHIIMMTMKQYRK